MFSLKDLKSLPTLREIEELAGEGMQEKQEELPLEDVLHTVAAETSAPVGEER
ncbi:MAG: hypothetical protein MZV70_73690 [Desulfobacterales bacterium]|nr:hypothetical protein [Desulfobacterales bacterium]